MPKVSIIVNCHNGAQYLREALDSAYAQTFPEWEIVFWDNQSTDNSAEIAKSYDSKLRYFKSESFTTLGAARRLAIERANADWAGFLDTDDFWSDSKLEIQMAALENSRYVLSYGGITEITEGGKKIREVLPKHESGFQLEQQLNQFEMHLASAMVYIPAMREHNLSFDDNIVASEEYNLFIRLAAKGPVHVIHRPISFYRIKESSLSTKTISIRAYERRYTLAQLRCENPGIEHNYPGAFAEASARAEYYSAIYSYHIGDLDSAKSAMRGISRLDYKYRLLYLSLFVPYLWRAVHSNLIKRVILPKLFRLVG